MSTIQLINVERLDDGRLNGFYNIESEIYCDEQSKELFLNFSKKISVYKNGIESELIFIPNSHINNLLKESIILLNDVKASATKLTLLKLGNLIHSYFSKFCTKKDIYIILEEN